MTTGQNDGKCANPAGGPGGMPLALRLSEGLGIAGAGDNIAEPSSEWISAPGVERATDIPPRQIVAVVLAGPRAARVQWALTVPGESAHSRRSHAEVASTGLFFLGIACLWLGLVAMLQRASDHLRAR